MAHPNLFEQLLISKILIAQSLSLPLAVWTRDRRADIIIVLIADQPESLKQNIHSSLLLESISFS